MRRLLAPRTWHRPLILLGTALLLLASCSSAETNAEAFVDGPVEAPTADVDQAETQTEPSAEGDTDTEGDTVEEAACLLYTSPSPRDATLSRMPSSA